MLGKFSKPGTLRKKIIILMGMCRGEEAGRSNWVIFAAWLLFTVVVAFALEAKSWLVEIRVIRSLWILCGLCFVYWVAGFVMFASRPDINVFLDQICIKQQDNEMKVNTILSLAGIMKKSDTMLILWDPTWTESLWCLVELAAFLKSLNNPDEELAIMPIFLGPAFMTVSLTAFVPVLMLLLAEPDSADTTTILLPPFSDFTLSIAFLLCALIAAHAAVSALRSYFRSVENMQKRLLSISFNETRCYCCDRNHVSPSGKPMVCDRKVFTHCIIHWFGGQESFEDILRSEVRRRMAIGLVKRVFSRQWVLAATRPLLFGYMLLGWMEFWSAMAYEANSDSFTQEISPYADRGGSHMILSFGIWQLFPQFVHLVTCVCRHMQARPDSHRLEFAKNAAIVVVLGIPIFGLMACVVWINGYEGFSGKTERALVFVYCLAVFAIFANFAELLINRIAGPEVIEEETSESFRSSERLDR